jgi:MYXO-CTERM domain-containing protein
MNQLGPSGIPGSNGAGTYPTSGTTTAQALAVAAGINVNGACGPVSQTAIYLCLEISGGTTNTIDTNGTIGVDFSVPAAPSPSLVAGDSHISVNWTAVGSALLSTTQPTSVSGTTRGYNVYVGQGGVFGNPQIVNGGGTATFDVQNLTNGTLYDIRMTTLSGGGNESAFSPTVQGTPELVFDFWRTYQFDGGKETGGCATGEVGLMALLGLVPLALRRNRRRS